MILEGWYIGPVSAYKNSRKSSISECGRPFPPPFTLFAPFLFTMSELAERPLVRVSETSSTYARDPNATHLAFADCEHCTRYPNRWSRIRLARLLSSFSALLMHLIREHIREPAAEFLGTMILVIFGCGGNCQTVLSSNPAVSSRPQGVSPENH